MSPRILWIGPGAALPFTVLALLVEMLAMIIPSALTASNSKLPPEVKGSARFAKRCPNCWRSQESRIQGWFAHNVKASGDI